MIVTNEQTFDPDTPSHTPEQIPLGVPKCAEPKRATTHSDRKLRETSRTVTNTPETDRNRPRTNVRKPHTHP
jgi:hypothetical protein